MYLQYLVLSLFSTTVYGGFNLNFDSKGDALENAAIDFTGEDVAVIKENERESFGITDGPLKDACGKVSGRRPDHVWLYKPTLWGDMYTMYNWREVTRTLRPIGARVVGKEQKPTIVSSQIYKNRSSRTVKMNGKISQEVTNTVENKWSQTHGLSVTASMTYSFKVVEASMEIGYTSEWGKEETKSESVAVGQEMGFEVELEPGESVEAVLSATKGSMIVDVTYRATLDGCCAINYNKGWKGHHYYCYPIGLVQDTGKLKKHVDIKETIKIGFYSDSHVIVRDKHAKK
uniref:U-megalopygitoxin(8)-Mc8 n=1 Tax=Megalopyge crispata TaxID=1407617 RepID=TXU88_MEGCS|nr:venom protein U-MPTX.8-Mc8 [Megalopyge crispata]